MKMKIPMLINSADEDFSTWMGSTVRKIIC